MISLRGKLCSVGSCRLRDLTLLGENAPQEHTVERASNLAIASTNGEL